MSSIIINFIDFKSEDITCKLKFEVSDEWLKKAIEAVNKASKEKEVYYAKKGLAGIFKEELQFFYYAPRDKFNLRIGKPCTVYENGEILQEFVYSLIDFPLPETAKDTIQELATTRFVGKISDNDFELVKIQ